MGRRGVKSELRAAYPALYNACKNLRQRCLNPNHSRAEYYSAAGITLCPEWAESLTALVEWAVGQGWAPGLQIDRRDGTKGYSPDNCRLVTQEENKRNYRLIKRNNTTGFRGVSPCAYKGTTRFVANLSFDGKSIIQRAGVFSSPVAAALYRDWHVVHQNLGYELNFPGLSHKLTGPPDKPRAIAIAEEQCTP